MLTKSKNRNREENHLTATITHVREKFHGRPLNVEERQETEFVAEKLIHLKPETVRLLLQDTDQIIAWAEREHKRNRDRQLSKRDMWSLLALYFLIAMVVIAIILSV